MYMDHQRSLSTNPNCSREMQFAFRFMGALARIKRSASRQQQPLERRSRRIKLAADASMATTIGCRRRWSRALLFKLQNQAKKRRSCVMRRRKVLRIGRHGKEKKPMTKRKNKKKIDIGLGGGGCEAKRVLQTSTGGDDHELFTGKADRLRRLVPGGEAMDLCKLLEETSHYIKCLSTQVQVMQSIADIYTTTSTTPSTKT